MLLLFSLRCRLKMFKNCPLFTVRVYANGWNYIPSMFYPFRRTHTWLQLSCWYLIRSLIFSYCYSRFWFFLVAIIVSYNLGLITDFLPWHFILGKQPNQIPRPAVLLEHSCRQLLTCTGISSRPGSLPIMKLCNSVVIPQRHSQHHQTQ